MNNPKLKNDTAFLRSYFVCETHFRKEYVKQNGKLKKLVLPTEFLEGKWIIRVLVWVVYTYVIYVYLSNVPNNTVSHNRKLICIVCLMGSSVHKVRAINIEYPETKLKCFRASKFHILQLLLCSLGIHISLRLHIIVTFWIYIIVYYLGV